MKKILITLGVIIIIAAIIVIAVMMNNKHSAEKCKQVLVTFSTTGESCITEKEIENYTFNNGKSFVIGEEISKIDIRKIEKTIAANPYVAKTEVFITPDGILKIQIQPRIPLMRVMNQSGQSYYIDDQAVMMPAQKPARVMVANGNIHDIYIPSRKLFILENQKRDSLMIIKQPLNRLFILGSYIYNDEFLRSFVQQIYVNDNGDFELIPLVGNFSIIFGGLENVKEKFENIKIFYTKVLLNMGWDKYKSINVKFKNQIICNKNQ